MSSFLSAFNQMKSVLCMCPNCNDISRLSDMHLRVKGKAPITWLDTYEKKLDKITDKENKFAEEEQRIRQEATQRGRDQVPKLVKKSMDPRIVALKYDPYDIKAILHPIDFVVFDGMNKNDMKDIVLLSRKTKNPHINTLHKAIEKVISKKEYDWKVIRVNNDNGELSYE